MDKEERWIQGTFNAEDTEEYVGILHIRPELNDRLKSGNPVQFSTYALQWLEVFAKPHLASTTYVCYRQQLKKHILPVFAERDIREIETVDLQMLFNERAYLKLETQRKIRGILNMIFTAAVDDELIGRNPVQSPRLKLTNRQRTEREPLGTKEMAAIREGIPRLEHESDRRYLAIQMSMALRPCEVLGLKWEDVDLQSDRLRVRRNVVHPTRSKPEVKELKTESSYRSIPISELARAYLETGGEGFLFGGEKPLSYHQFREMWKRIGGQIDLHGATGYVFRHTILTDLYDATKDVKTTQLYAGHSTPDMTMRRYVHGRNENLREAGKALDRLYEKENEPISSTECCTASRSRIRPREQW